MGLVVEREVIALFMWSGLTWELFKHTGGIWEGKRGTEAGDDAWLTSIACEGADPIGWECLGRSSNWRISNEGLKGGLCWSRHGQLCLD